MWQRRRVPLVRLKDREDTEDIFQTVFLKYLQHTKPFESAEHEKAWFIQVTLNACRDLLRFWARRPTVPLEEPTAQAARDAGLSLGKYRAYLALSALDPSVTQDEAGEMTMGELQQCIDACQGHAYGQQGYGQGSGQGNGYGQTAGETTSSGQGSGSGGRHGAGHGHGHE